ncbi:hypothetical protein DL771_004335 [Monosporascus sp. 5C6A]|nr:hypothetical protein DL771_004335 [Monosporascus sp. 5C6A]
MAIKPFHVQDRSEIGDLLSYAILLTTYGIEASAITAETDAFLKLTDPKRAQATLTHPRSFQSRLPCSLQGGWGVGGHSSRGKEVREQADGGAAGGHLEEVLREGGSENRMASAMTFWCSGSQQMAQKEGRRYCTTGWRPETSGSVSSPPATSTSNTIFWAVKRLTAHQEVQQKLRTVLRSFHKRVYDRSGLVHQLGDRQNQCALPRRILEGDCNSECDQDSDQGHGRASPLTYD